MHSLAKKFMMARKLNFGENGRAELLDDQVFLMDGKMLSEIEARSGDEVSYAIGGSVGKNLAENIKRTGISGTKMTEFMMDLLTMMGLGEFEIHSFDLKTKKGEVRVKDCIVARGGESDGNCNVVAGILSGVLASNYDQDFEVVEKGCVRKGDDLCRFNVQSS